ISRSSLFSVDDFLEEKTVSGNVKRARSTQAPDRGLCGLLSGKKSCFRQNRFEGSDFRSDAGQWPEENLRVIETSRRCRIADSCGSKTPATRRQRRPTECRIGDNHRWVFVFAWNLQPQ